MRNGTAMASEVTSCFPQMLRNCQGELQIFHPQQSRIKKSLVLRCSFLLALPIFGAALAPSLQGAVRLLCTVDSSLPLSLSWNPSSHTYALALKSLNLTHIAWLDHSSGGSFSKHSHGTKSHPGGFPESINKDSITFLFILDVNHQRKSNLLLKQID